MLLAKSGRRYVPDREFKVRFRYMVSTVGYLHCVVVQLLGEMVDRSAGHLVGSHRASACIMPV